MRFFILGLAVIGLIAFRSQSSNSDSQRKMIWRAAIDSFTERPYLGVGPDGFAHAFRRHKPTGFGHEFAINAHNDILQVLVTCGAIGLGFYLFFWTNLLISAKGPLLGALVAMFLIAKFNPISLESIVTMAFLCGIYASEESQCIPIFAKCLIVSCAILVAFRLGNMALADYQAKLGNFKLANTLNPYERIYRINAY